MVKDAVLITGCSAGGLGSGLALAFHEKNIHVFATARSLSRLSHLSSLPNVTCLEIDVTSQTSIARAVDAVQSKLEMIEGGGRLRYLVNNAGRGLVAPMLDFDEKDARDVFETNFWGGVSVLKAFVPLMLKGVAREGGKEKAVIVNVGSSAGVLNAPWNGVTPPFLFYC
jgi:1-acylglycerone phosphate reductase